MNPRQIELLEANREVMRQLKRVHPLDQLFWECTLRCNMACRHCGSDCSADVLAKDMSLEDFLPVLDAVAERYDASNILVNTVGGEPLVRKDILECGREIKRRGFEWGMVTNGILLDEPMMDKLLDVGLDSLSVDLDGPREQHDWLRRDNRGFDRAMRAIGQMRRATDLAWDVITCVHKRNLAKLEETKRILIDAGVEHWRCFTVVPMGRATGDDNLALSDSEFRDLLNFIVKTRIEGKIDLNYACEGFLGAYEGLARDHMYACHAGLTVASIRYDGNISGCLSIRGNYHQGNIYTDDFIDVWENRFQPYRDREWMKRGSCGDCKMFRYCEGNGFHLRGDDGELMLCHYRRLKNIPI